MLLIARSLYFVVLRPGSFSISWTNFGFLGTKFPNLSRSSFGFNTVILHNSDIVCVRYLAVPETTYNEPPAAQVTNCDLKNLILVKKFNKHIFY